MLEQAPNDRTLNEHRDRQMPTAEDVLRLKVEAAASKSVEACAFNYWQANGDIGFTGGHRWGQC